MLCGSCCSFLCNGWSVQVDLLLAMSDYGIFMQMMRQVAKDYQAKQAASSSSEGKEVPEEDEPASSESKK